MNVEKLGKGPQNIPMSFIDFSRNQIRKLFTGLKLVLPFSKASILIGSSVTTLKEQTMVLVDRLSEIMVPTLVVWGAKDPIVPVRQAYAAAQLIPCCQLKVFEGCGHSVYRQRIQGFSQLVTGFLSWKLSLQNATVDS